MWFGSLWIKENRTFSEHRWRVVAFQLGMICIVSQIIVIRELMNLFSGNELVIGITMANWMILTALGSVAGRYAERCFISEKKWIALMLVLNLIPALTVIGMHGIKNQWLPYGVAPGLDDIQILSLMILFPFCFLSGFVFVIGCGVVFNKFKTGLTGLMYSWESAGSAAGGILFNVILIYFLPAMQLLAVLFIVNGLLLLWISHSLFRRPVFWIVAFLHTAAVVVFFGWDWDHLLREYALGGQKVVYYRDTPYGNLTVTEQDGQRNYYENDIWIGSGDEVRQNEETVHFTMIQHPHPQRVLTIGGSVRGQAAELLKYGHAEIDYAEVNPWWLRDSAFMHPSLFSHRITIVPVEPRRYVRETKHIYDVVIISLPDPSTAALNRFYTYEFIGELKQRMNEKSVVSFGLASSEDYLSREKRRAHSVIARTVSGFFRNTLILPGVKDYLLASDCPLVTDIATRIGEKVPDTKYVNSFYIQDDWLLSRSLYIKGMLDPSAPGNHDFRPLAYFDQIRLWLSSAGYSAWIYIFAAVFILMLIVVNFDPVSFGLLTAGWTGATVEVLLLIAFQILFANVYFMMGLLITVFMAGLAAGSRIMMKSSRFRGLTGFGCLQMFLGAASVLSVAAVTGLSVWMPEQAVIYSVMIFMMMVISVLTGMMFTVATRLRETAVVKSASVLYGMDMIGSGSGVLVMTIMIYPLWGLWASAGILFSMNIFCALLAYFYSKGSRDEKQ